MIDKIFKRWEFYYLLMMAFLPLMVNPYGFRPYEIPKQVFFILGIVFVLLNFIFSKGKGLRFLYNKYVFAFVCLWLASLVVSTVAGVVPMESFWGSTERLQGLFTWILYLLHFFICLQIFGDGKWRKVFFNLVIGAGIILSIYAILQHFGIDPLGISDINEASGRSFATLGQPNFLGQWLIFPFMIVFMRIFGERRRWVYGVLLLIIAAALATTLNRASILGIGISLLIFFIYKYRSRMAFWKFAGGGLVMTGLAAFLIYSGGFRSINSRFYLLKPIAPLIEETWLSGSGPESFYQTYQKVLDKEIYLTENLANIPDRAHNETLQILLDQGIFGFVLYVFLIGFLLSLLFGKEKFGGDECAAYFAIIASFISLQFSFSTSAHTTIVMAMLGILLTSKLKFREISFNFGGIFLRFFVKFLLLTGSVFYLWNGCAMFMADFYFAKAMETYFSPTGEAAEYFGKAIKFNPNSRYYLYTAANLLSVGENQALDKKIPEYLEKLGELTCKNFYYDLAMAQYFASKKDYEKQEEFFSNAAQKAPNWPFVWLRWGDALFEKGKKEEALSKYGKLAELAPPYKEWDNEKQRLFKKNNEIFLEALGRMDEAEKR